MKLALLTRNPVLYSIDRIARAAVARGHDVLLIDPLACQISVEPGELGIHCSGTSLEGVDAIVPRIGPQLTFHGVTIVRQFEMMGVLSINSSSAIARSRDKLAALQHLANGGIPMPISGFAHSVDFIEDLINLVGGPPLVVKLLEGSQGIGVVLSETRQAAQSVVEAFRGVNTNVLIQEFIAESYGEDLRCIVLGDRVIASMIRRAVPGEFRSNLHRGGGAVRAELSSDETETALAAVRLLGLRVAGIDMLRSKRGPLVIEVNSSPGLEGIETATGVDVAEALIENVESLT